MAQSICYGLDPTPQLVTATAPHRRHTPMAMMAAASPASFGSQTATARSAEGGEGEKPHRSVRGDCPASYRIARMPPAFAPDVHSLHGGGFWEATVELSLSHLLKKQQRRQAAEPANPKPKTDPVPPDLDLVAISQASQTATAGPGPAARATASASRGTGATAARRTQRPAPALDPELLDLDLDKIGTISPAATAAPGPAARTSAPASS